MVLDDLLARDGLPAGERILIWAQTLIWPGRWEELAACFTRARDEGVPRGHLEELLLQAILCVHYNEYLGKPVEIVPKPSPLA